MVKGVKKKIVLLCSFVIAMAIILILVNNFMGDQLLTLVTTDKFQTILWEFDKVLIMLFLLFSAGMAYCLFYDVNDMVNQQAVSSQDAVTQLPNIAVYHEDITGILLNEAARDYIMVALDIDKFKAVNEIFGFACGTKIIKMVANMLSKRLHKDEKCYRIGNDVFYLLLKSYGRDEDYARIKDILDNIVIELVSTDDKEFLESFDGGIYNHVLSFSAGAVTIQAKEMKESLAGYEGEVLQERCLEMVAKIADNANIARKQGKNKNENSVAIFDESMRQAIVEDKKIEDAFLIGIERGEFMIYYQPKFCIDGDEAVHGGAEALVRWDSTELGFMPPGKFIPLFERDGNAIRLDMHVVDLVCQNICEWLSKGLEVVPVSINVSRPTMVNGPGYFDYVRERLFLYDVPQELIEFEILESSSEVDEDMVVAFINELHSRGFKISIDDFGTGMSSLGLLRRIPLDTLKLDKSFFDDMSLDMSAKDSAVIRYMIQMAKTMDIRTIAEGIEQKFQVDMLKEYGCDMIQGYYFSRPLAAPDYEKMLKKAE
ncbi:MAG: EAL domain-containing protein [Anaerovibrio sp.]|nr:EAL domain-containing protein [Anaerovibrio sp.]